MYQKNLDNEELNLHKSLSDHKILSVVINNIEEVQRNRVKLINRNLSMKITHDSLKSATSLQNFLENHKLQCNCNNYSANSAHDNYISKWSEMLGTFAF